MKSGTHCTYFRLESLDKDGNHPVSSFPAVILSEDIGSEGAAHVAFLDPGKLHVIGGSDWRDAFSSAHSVPLGQGEGRDWYEPLPDIAEVEKKAAAHIRALRADLQNTKLKLVAATKEKE